MLLSVPAGHGLLYGLIMYGIGVLILALIVRAICSWVGINERYAFIRFLAKITDPFITPLRRFVPRIGIFDVSFILAFLFMGTLQVLLLQSLPLGW